MNNFELKNWIPYKLRTTDNKLQCHWLNTFNKNFTEPFFDETIARCFTLYGEYAELASVSDLQMIEPWAAELDTTAPNVIIFHISRCGSTLVSQLLATSGQNIVLAEVPFFDELLRLPYQVPGFDRNSVDKLLASAIKFYGQKRTGHEQRLFIKADSWHIFFYQQLRNLYPTVPFILMYRKPDEVFRSHRKQRGMHAAPGLIEPEVFGFKTKETDLDIYLANVLERYFEKYLEIIAIDSNSLLLNYDEGAMPIINKIADFAGISFSQQALQLMTDRSLYHSKNPNEKFLVEFSSAVPQCLDKAMKLYMEVEGKRTGLIDIVK